MKKHHFKVHEDSCLIINKVHCWTEKLHHPEGRVAQTCKQKGVCVHVRHPGDADLEQMASCSSRDKR